MRPTAAQSSSLGSILIDHCLDADVVLELKGLGAELGLKPSWYEDLLTSRARS